MAQHTIGISEEAFTTFNQTKHKLNARGFNFSSARCLLYLIERKIVEAFSWAVNAEKAQDGYDHLRAAISSQMNYYPPILPRNNYKPSKYATVERRAYIVQQIRERHGIDNPPRVLVDYYLDNSEAESAMRAHVLKNMDLQGSPAPDTPAQP
jgi:hypothetical protein